ncbi:MAG: hypothetical protein HGA76_02135 [Candidatus Firestonebacteria bacterium]|nr:hypothetical protein [Candidatus Firestonebacteria bacterium]
MRRYAAALAAGWLVLGGCGRVDLPPRLLQYEFQDQGPYRVVCAYNSEKRLVKKHAGRVFAETHEGTHVETTYRVEAEREPGGGWVVAYTLLRLRLHDEDGRFKLEIGPEGGEVFWYQDTQSLEDYLGPEIFQTYRRQVRLPLARVHVHADGGQVPNGLEFNFSLLHTLGKNRVYGDFLARGIKVPPVLMMVFKQASVRAGDTWDYAGNSGNAATHFSLTALSTRSAQVACVSDFSLGDEELTTVRKALQLEAASGLVLKESRMRVTGSVEFLLPAGRPEKGKMHFEKFYAMSLPAETWQLQETEDFKFSLTVSP